VKINFDSNSPKQLSEKHRNSCKQGRFVMQKGCSCQMPNIHTRTFAHEPEADRPSLHVYVKEAFMRIIPTVDFVFKKLLGSADHPNLTKSFLNGILEHMGKPLVQEVTILNPFSSADYRMGRDIILDVHVKDEQGREYQVEMQTRSGPWLARRMLHNACHLYGNAFPKGDEYKLERPVLAIWLLEETLLPQQSWFIDYQLRTKLGHCLCNDLLIVVLQLARFRQELVNLLEKDVSSTINQKLGTWLDLFSAPHGVEPMELPVPANFPEFREAIHIMANIDRSRRARIAYWNRIEGKMQARSIELEALEAIEQGTARGIEQGMAIGMAQGLQKGLQQGVQQGRMEGEKEASIKLARKLLAEGFSSEKVTVLTGLNNMDLSNLENS